jgi:uncharacterized membrane protein YcaP (DUF421 family)
MIDGEFRDAALRASRVSRDNIMEAIRSSPARSFDEVQAVILETTGDMTVIAGERLDPRLVAGVRGFGPGADRSGE